MANIVLGINLSTVGKVNFKHGSHVRNETLTKNHHAHFKVQVHRTVNELGGPHRSELFIDHEYFLVLKPRPISQDANPGSLHVL